VLAACGGSPTKESTGEFIDDAAITTKVKTAFVEDKAVKAANVKVETFKGTVQLSGFAESGKEIDRAAEIASKVPGVKSVRNSRNGDLICRVVVETPIETEFCSARKNIQSQLAQHGFQLDLQHGGDLPRALPAEILGMAFEDFGHKRGSPQVATLWELHPAVVTLLP